MVLLLSQVGAEPAIKVEVLRTKVEITLVKVGVLRHLTCMAWCLL